MQVQLGEGLRAARLAMNLSQPEVARQSGISMNAVRHLEAGKNAPVFSLLALCQTLRRTGWISTLAPPEGPDPAEFMRTRRLGPRKRAMPKRKKAAPPPLDKGSGHV